MKHKDSGKSSCDRRNPGLILSHQMSNSSAPGQQACAPQYSQQSIGQNANQRFMPTSSQSVLKGNASQSSCNVGPPANVSNLTSFQQSHSERTSMTDEAHTAGLISMHWQAVNTNNPHAQCSTERYTNDQKVRFMQQLHSSNETLVTSQTGGNSLVNASSSVGGAGILSQKQHKEKQFFVTDHKLYEEQAMIPPQSEHGSMLKASQDDNSMKYDTEIDTIKVNQVSVNQLAMAKNQNSLCLTNKACKK